MTYGTLEMTIGLSNQLFCCWHHSINRDHNPNPNSSPEQNPILAMTLILTTTPLEKISLAAFLEVPQKILTLANRLTKSKNFDRAQAFVKDPFLPSLQFSPYFTVISDYLEFFSFYFGLNLSSTLSLSSHCKIK